MIKRSGCRFLFQEISMVFALGFALFATAFSEWCKGTLDNQTTVTSGGLIASEINSNISCQLYPSCWIPPQMNGFAAFNSTICQGQFYELVGQFGWCSDGFESTQTTTPTEAHTMFVLMLVSCMMITVSMILGCCTPFAINLSFGIVSLVTGSISVCCLVSSCLIASRYSWYQLLFSVSSVPFPLIDSNGFLVLMYTTGPVTWGRSMWYAIASIILISIGLLSVLYTILVKSGSVGNDEFENNQKFVQGRLSGPADSDTNVKVVTV